MLRPVTGFVLAGGKSSRMGANKALLSLDGATLLQRTQQLLQSVCQRVFILGQKELYGSFGECVEDVYPECGPLGGIHAALLNSSTQFNLITAVDTPFLTAELLDYLVDQATQSQAVVTTPRLGGFDQPLCSVYSREFLTIAEASLKSGTYKIVPLFPRQRTLVIREAELAEFGVTPEIFDNLNTPEDMERARRRSSAQHS